MRKLFVAVCGVFLLAGPAWAQDDDHLRDFRDKLIGKAPLVKTGISALFGEAINSPEEWGRGIDGFGKRFANSYAQRTIRAGVELGVSTWTHEDLRFHRLGEGSVWTRVKHVVVGRFWVPRDNGPGHTLAVGRITGAVAAGQMSRLWMPASVSGFGHCLGTSGSGIGVDVGFDFVREFWPKKR